MSFKRVDGPKVHVCSHNLVNRFRDMKPCPSDRPVRERILKVVREAIKEGDFRPPEWASALCKEDGETYRVNGKHTSTVLSELNGELSSHKVIISHYECDTKEDLAKLYTTFDRRESSRNSNDINRIYAASLPSLADLPSKIVNLSVTGMAYRTWEAEAFNHSHQDRAELLIACPDFPVWFGNIIEGAENTNDRKHLLRSSVVAAMFGCWEKSRTKAAEFWSLVRDASGPDKHSVDRRLNDLLKSSAVRVGIGASSAKATLGARAMYVKCIHGWNAWRNGTTTDFKYYETAKTPAFA